MVFEVILKIRGKNNPQVHGVKLVLETAKNRDLFSSDIERDCMGLTQRGARKSSRSRSQGGECPAHLEEDGLIKGTSATGHVSGSESS